MVQFKYIKPEEVEEYLRRGYKVDRGPRGGIRAYSPGKDVTSQEAFETLLKVTEESPVYRTLLNGAYFWLVRKKNADIGLSFVAPVVLGLMKTNPSGAEEIINTFWGSQENFDVWFKENVIKVKDDEKLFNYQLLSDSAVEVNGEYIVFKPVVMKIFSTELSYERFGYYMERHVWQDDKLSLYKAQEAFDIVKGKIESFLEGDNLQDVFDTVEKLIDGFAELTRDILHTETVLVEDDRVQELVWNLWDNFEEVQNDYVSFENILVDDIDFIDGFIGDYSARLVSIYFLFRKLGASKEEAKSLAKGWETTRFWTGSSFKVYTHDIEKLITKCNGNGRVVRVNLDARNDKERLGKLFFEKYADCNSFNSWRKFVQEYLKKYFDSDKITVYRGVRYREVLLGLMEFIETGKVRIGGVAESATIDREVASDWSSGGWVAESNVPAEYVIGCWLNASASHADDEVEIMIEKPKGGLPVNFTNDTYGSHVLFEDGSWIESGDLKEWCEKNGYDYEIIERSLQEVLANGALGIYDLYWENKEFMKEFTREFVDIVRNFGWEDLFNDNDEGVELDDLIAEYLEEDNEFGFGDVSRYVDELVAKVTELKKERQFKYIKPEEVEEYRARGYKIEEGPKGGIRAYFPDVDKNVDVEIKSPYHPSIKAFKSTVRDMQRVDLSSLDPVDRLRIRPALRKAFDSFRYEMDIEKGRAFVAAVILMYPQLFEEYKWIFWGGEEEFDKWVRENTVYVKHPSAAKVLVGSMQLFEIDGKLITFKGIVKSAIKGRLESHGLFEYVWFRSSPDFVEKFIANAEELKASVDKAFDGASGIVDEVVSRVVKMAIVVGDILDQESVDVDYSKVEQSIEAFENMVNERIKILEDISYGDYDAVYNDYFSFENLFGDIMDEAELYMDKYSARLFVVATAFMKMGFSKEEAYSMAKGWELARFWTGSTFKTYTHHIEKKIVECKGNGRPIRRPYGEPNEYGYVFFKRYASCKDLENWRKFVQAYLKKKYGDTVRIYRGIKAREVGQAVIDFILDGEVRLGGVTESSTVDKREAVSWGWQRWIFTTELPVEYAVGCWLNASRNYALKEREVMFEKPPGGLVGEVVNEEYKNQNGIFSDDVFTDPDMREKALYIMETGLESIKRTYGEDSEFYKVYRDRMMKAKSILTGNVIKSLLKSINW